VLPVPVNNKPIAKWVNDLNRRTFIFSVTAGLTLFTALQLKSGHNKLDISAADYIKKWDYDDEFWRVNLTPSQYAVLRDAATEPRYSSRYVKLFEPGNYLCAGCKLELFTSEMKYDSKTGWPSFKDHIKGHLEVYTDFRTILPSTAYSCAQCGGHQGHLIMDGPLPTGQRWCNNGVALEFRSPCGPETHQPEQDCISAT